MLSARLQRSMRCWIELPLSKVFLYNTHVGNMKIYQKVVKPPLERCCTQNFLLFRCKQQVSGNPRTRNIKIISKFGVYTVTSTAVVDVYVSNLVQHFLRFLAITQYQICLNQRSISEDKRNVKVMPKSLSGNPRPYLILATIGNYTGAV